MSHYRLVTAIINVTAIIAMLMPMMIFVVSGSPSISVPTSMAVIGSNTPNTDAFVAPMLRVAMANVAVDTMVGSIANPIMLSQALQLSSPAVMGVDEKIILPKKTMAPTNSA